MFVPSSLVCSMFTQEYLHALACSLLGRRPSCFCVGIVLALLSDLVPFANLDLRYFYRFLEIEVRDPTKELLFSEEYSRF